MLVSGKQAIYVVRTFEVLVGKIEQEDKDNATVVSVNNTSARVNHELRSYMYNSMNTKHLNSTLDVPRPLRGATRP